MIDDFHTAQFRATLATPPTAPVLQKTIYVSAESPSMEMGLCVEIGAAVKVRCISACGSCHGLSCQNINQPEDETSEGDAEP